MIFFVCMDESGCFCVNVDDSECENTGVFASG